MGTRGSDGALRSGELAALTALAEVTRALAEATSDYRALLQTVVEQVTRLLGDGCAVSLLSDDGARIVPVAVAMRDPEATALAREAFAAVPRDGTDVGLAMSVARSGRPVILSPVEPDDLAKEVPFLGDWIRQAGVRGVLVVRLRAGSRTLGTLSLYRTQVDGPPFGDADRAFAESLALHAGQAIANARLLESLRLELEERRRAQEQAKTFVALVETSTDFIAMAGFDGRVLYLNAAGRRLVGIGPTDDVRAMSLSDFHTEDGLARAEILRREGSWQGEGVLRHFVTGELIPVQVSSFIARDVDGQAVCFATVQHDLRETRRLEGQLRLAQKMEAVGRLAGGVAHDFNNLLSIILSYAALVAAELPEGSPGRADLAEIEAAGQRAAALTRQLLAIGRHQILQLRVVDMRELVTGMWRLFQGTLGEDVELRSDLAPDLAPVFADRGQLEQVLLNLVVNARDAMPGGGVLTISALNVRVAAGDRLTSSGLAPGEYVALTVTDTGAGMDPSTRGRIFEPFFTTKEVGKGTGLGLSTVLGIVKQSGGHVVVESEPGQGSSFGVYLQRFGGGIATQAPAHAAPASAARGNEVILVVEDERSVRALTCRVLRDAGYEVVEAAGADEALRASRELGNLDLLVTDVVMPGMGGRELADHVVAGHPESIVLYVSGHSEEALGRRGVLDPGIELLRKPLTPVQLLEKVRQLLDRRSARPVR